MEDRAAEAIEVLVRALRAGARIPVRGSELASGFDLHACLEAPVTLSQVPVMIPTGLAFAVPAGFDAQVRPRSGLARKGVIATFGTIDADYRGELMVTLYTTSSEIQHVVEDGDRIAQLVVTRLAEVRFSIVEELSGTTRGAGGHGSTGR